MPVPRTTVLGATLLASLPPYVRPAPVAAPTTPAPALVRVQPSLAPVR